MRLQRRVWLILAAVLLTLALLVAATLGTVWWAARSESGSAWLLSRLPGVKVTQPRGNVWGDFAAQRIELQWPGSADRVVLTDAGWRGLRVQRHGASSQWARLSLDELYAARVQVLLAPSADTTPLAAPTDLRLPLEVEIASLRIGQLDLAALGEQPLRDVKARVHLGADGGQQHRVDALSLAWDRLRAQGSAHIGTRMPLALEAQLSVTQDAVAGAAGAAGGASATAEWRASARLAGPLAQTQLRGSVRARATAAQAEQTLDVDAELRPFAAWPLGRLNASTQSLDLSALHGAAPLTALTGSATASTTGVDQPAQVTLNLSNAAAGLWNEARLPLRTLAAQLVVQAAGKTSTSPTSPTLTLQSFDAELGSAKQAAGHVTGQASWSAQRWSVDAMLAGLQPSLLDARAAPMRLNGPLSAVSTGFDPAAPERATIELRADLTGDLSGVGTRALPSATAARSVRLKLDASLNRHRIEVREALAVAGGARATLAGLATQAAPDSAWQLKGQASLVDFDPLPWWPGRDDSPWRRGPHRVNAKGEFDLNVPVSAPTATAPTTPPATLPPWLAAMTGNVKLAIAQSVLAGVPLRGDVSLASLASGSGPPTAATLNAMLDLAGNTLKLAGRADTRPGTGAADTWDVALQAPALQRLAPLWRLATGSGAALPASTRNRANTEPLAGSLTATARINGRWPDLTTQGQLEGSSLRVADVSVQKAQARWQAGTAANAAIDVQATLAQLTIGQPSLDTLALQVQGTAASHRIELRGESKLLPPVWVDALQATQGASTPSQPAPSPQPPTSPPPPGTRQRSTALLQAQGGLVDVPGTRAAGWRGTLQQLEVRSTGAPGPAAPPWVRARDLNLEARWSGAAPRVAVQPGRAELLGAALRWTRLMWQGAYRPPGGAAQMMQIDVQGEFDPLPVAPLLARLQPDFGWGGDLLLAGRINVRSAPSFGADIVVERSRGDLTVTDEIGTQALGLSDLRVALNAQDGVWSFTQALAGKTLGVAAGAVVARTSPQATWPSPDTPIQGVLELQVANLGTWGTWVPAGWRLNGALRTSATIAGRFGAPEYTGEVRGTGLGLRNFLQGVNVSDGDVSITLQGATARIERFTARAGAGSVSLAGDATLGDKPRALLKLRADKFQLLGRVDRRIVATGDAQLQLDRDTLALNGKFSVDEGLIDFTRSDAPSLSDDVVVVRRPAQAGSAASAAAPLRPAPPTAPGTAPAAVSPASPVTRTVALDLQVDLGRQLRLKGRGIDTGLRGGLHITAPGGKLAINGTVSTADGTYAAYGQKLTIDRGSIAFNGPAENPRLDIEATRPNTDTRVGVLVTGTALNPRIRLFSEPEVSDIDKLSWLVLGRASDGLGRADTALLQRAAVALLAGEGGGLTDQFTKAIGLDDVSLRQTDGEVRETVISLGKQLSRRWYVGYERGLNATAGTWQLIYRIAQRFTLRAQSGLDNSLDVIWTWRWQ